MNHKIREMEWVNKRRNQRVKFKCLGEIRECRTGLIDPVNGLVEVIHRAHDGIASLI